MSSFIKFSHLQPLLYYFDKRRSHTVNQIIFGTYWDYSNGKAFVKGSISMFSTGTLVPLRNHQFPIPHEPQLGHPRKMDVHLIHATVEIFCRYPYDDFPPATPRPL